MNEKLLKIRTLGELKSAGYQTMPVRMEMRKNLLERLRSKEQILPGIVGYEETVVPEIENGVLAGHHMIFLGERGTGEVANNQIAGRAARRARAGSRGMRNQ